MVKPHKILVVLTLLSSSYMAAAQNISAQAYDPELEKYQKCMELFNKHPVISRKVFDINITICAQFLPHPKKTPNPLPTTKPSTKVKVKK